MRVQLELLIEYHNIRKLLTALNIQKSYISKNSFKKLTTLYFHSYINHKLQQMRF